MYTSDTNLLIKNGFLDAVNQIDSFIDNIGNLDNGDDIYNAANDLLAIYNGSLDASKSCMFAQEKKEDSYKRSLKVASLLDQLYA